MPGILGRDFVRFNANDLDVLATYLFGERWQRSVARAIQRNERTVRRWVALEHPVSRHASRLIAQLTVDRYNGDKQRLDRAYLAMIDSLQSPGRGYLMALDAGRDVGLDLRPAHPAQPAPVDPMACARRACQLRLAPYLFVPVTPDVGRVRGLRDLARFAMPVPSSAWPLATPEF